MLVKRQRPAAAPFLIWDTKQAGLVLRVQPTGHRSWYCVYRHHARPRWHRLGNVDAIGLADARMLAAEIMLQAAKGLDPAAEKKAERSRGTFEELATRYVEEHAKRHNKSWRQADALIRRHLLLRWGKLQAASISRSDVKAVMARIEAPVVANQTLAAASAVFTWAMKEELIASNPCRGVDRNPTKSRERVLADSEVPLFWKAFDDAGLVVGSALKAILLTRPKAGRGRAYAPRAHQGWVVGDAGRDGADDGLGPAPRTRRRIGCGSLPRCGPSWPRWAMPPRASCSPVPVAVQCAVSMRRCARSVPSSVSSARPRTI